MIKDGMRSGSRCAALMVKPKHGVRLSTNFTVGTLDLAGLPATAEVGHFVPSPPKITVERSAANTSVGDPCAGKPGLGDRDGSST